MKPKPEDGLILRGQVIARKRRDVKQGDKTRFCISLVVRTQNQNFLVDRWSDTPLPEDTPSIGDMVDLPVVASAYLSHGVAMARLNWGTHASGGADF